MADFRNTDVPATSTTGFAQGGLPPAMAAMQAKVEQLYLKTLTLERDVAHLRAVHPVVVTRPKRAGFLTRVMRRINRRAARRYQLALIRNCGLFDGAWYLRTYPDVGEHAMDPAQHYLSHCATDLRNPGPHFDTDHYLHLYPDIAKIGMNPLVHYIVSGIDEGRSIRPSMPHDTARHVGDVA